MRTNLQNPALELRTYLKPRPRPKNGFTLIEIVLVLSIIAMLLGAGIYRLVGVNDRAKITRIHVDFKTFRTALNLYQMDAGTYPTTEQGLDALVRKPRTGRVPKSYRPYLEEVIHDPWGTPYAYVWPPKDGRELPQIYSLGRDGIDATGDEVFMRDGPGDEG